MYIKEGIRKYADEYGESRHLPQTLQRLFFRYLKMYLNSLDYIVVENRSVEEELKREGVCAPEFYEIPAEEEEKDSSRALLWLNLYRKMAA